MVSGGGGGAPGLNPGGGAEGAHPLSTDILYKHPLKCSSQHPPPPHFKFLDPALNPVHFA